MFEEKLQFAKLQGKVIRSIHTGDGRRIDFHLSDGSVYSLEPPCRPNEVSPSYQFLGDVAALVGAPVLAAELSTCDEDLDAPFRSTVCYRLRTVNGSAALRLSGELTGFYNVAVDFLTLQDSRDIPARGSVAPVPKASSGMDVLSERPPYDLSPYAPIHSQRRPMQIFHASFLVSSHAILEAQQSRLRRLCEEKSPQLQESYAE